jgi:hypothetical protein
MDGKSVVRFGGRTGQNCLENQQIGEPGVLRYPQVTISLDSMRGPSLTLRVTMENSPFVRKNHSLRVILEMDVGRLES